jgi:predicted nuclease with TOPRIM domain
MVQAHAHELLNQKETRNAVYAATERVAAALNRLESLVQQENVERTHDSGQLEQIQKYERENSALQEECARLDGAIASLRQEYDELHQVASTIYNKLDDSIRHLTEIVEQ